MMTQGEIEALTITMEKAAAQLEIDIMKDIVRRIKANEGMTSTAEYQINRLRQLGLSDAYIQEERYLPESGAPEASTRGSMGAPAWMSASSTACFTPAVVYVAPEIASISEHCAASIIEAYTPSLMASYPPTL